VKGTFDNKMAVMHAAARLTSRYDYITELLCHLHWLQAPQRISFKLTIMVYQCTGGLGPTYLVDALQSVARIPGWE